MSLFQRYTSVRLVVRKDLDQTWVALIVTLMIKSGNAYSAHNTNEPYKNNLDRHSEWLPVGNKYDESVELAMEGIALRFGKMGGIANSEI